MNAQTRAAQGSHNTARLFPNPKISLNAKEIRRLRGLVPPPPPPIPADWAPIDAHNEKKKEKKPYRYKRPKNLDEKGKYVLSETINCGAVRPISSVRFTPSGRHLALGSADAIGRFCQRRNGKWEVVLLFDEHEEGINDIQFIRGRSDRVRREMLRAGKDEHFAITCSDDKTVRLWDVRTGKQHRKFVGHQDYVFACSVHPTSTLFCSGSFDETIKLWDPRCPEAVREIKAHAEPITGVQFSPGDGSVIASGSYDGLTRLWDTASGSCLVTIYAEQAGLPAKQAPVSGLRYSPNGSYLLVSTHDTFMRLWNVGTQPVRASRFFEGCRSLRYNCNNGFHAPKNREGPVVVAGQEDGCLMIFDMNTGKLAHEVQAHRSPVLGMDNHPRNSYFVSCSMDRDNLARVWRYESHFSGREGDPDRRPPAPIVQAPDDGFVVPPVRQSYSSPAGAMDVG